MTTPLGAALVAVAAVSAAVAVQHLMIAARLRERGTHLLFALSAAAAAADAVTEMRLLRSATPGEFEQLMGMTAFFICTFLAALAWYVAMRTGAARRWLLVAETVALALTAALDLGLPHGISYVRIEALREVMLPWGEVIHFGLGDPSAWRLVGDVANLGFLLFLLDTTIRLYRRGERRGMRLIAGSLLLLSASVLLIIPVDLGLLSLPPTHPFAFLLIIAVMSWDLSDSVARTATLTREVASNERRWRQLLEDVQLLVVRVDRDGKVVAVNPHFTRVMGFRSDEVAGHVHLEFVAPGQREERRAAFEQAMAGQPTLEVEVEEGRRAQAHRVAQRHPARVRWTDRRHAQHRC